MKDEWGPWKEVAKPFPWRLFFRYYQMTTKTTIRYERRNRLDGLFTRLCGLLDRQPYAQS